MASLNIHPSLNVSSRTSLLQDLKSTRNCPRICTAVSCLKQDQDEPQKPNTVKDNERNLPLVSQVFTGLDKLGKGLRSNLSPQRKGDWKDVMLMSLSFAVYVYISQKIVCAYYAWMSMPKQPW